MIQEEFEGAIFRVEFVRSNHLRRNCYGKCWPLTTQCIVYRGNMVIATGEVIKHDNDIDDPYFARRNSAKKAFANTKIPWKEVRTRLWSKILDRDSQ